MAVNVDIDPVFRQALQFLHSPNTDSAENIRKVLDEMIKQRHGSSKMLANTLSKKHLAEEPLATGSGVIKTVMRRQSSKSSDSSNNSNSSPVQITATTTIGMTTGTTSATIMTTDGSGQQQEIPVIISLPDETGTAITTIDDNATDDSLMIDNQHLKDLEDLVCVVCRRIDLSAKNQLIECTKCNALYHQECHTPKISDSELSNGQESSWCCNACKPTKLKTIVAGSSPSKSTYSSPSSGSSSSSSSPVSSALQANSTSVITTVASVTTEATSSSSSSSSSKRHHDKEHSKSSSSRHHHHSSSSSSSSKHEKSSSSRTSSSSNSGKPVTPHVNIISAADKRIQNMKKKAAKTHESKRKK